MGDEQETLIEHLPEEATCLSSRQAPRPLAILERRPRHDPLVYPVIETWLTGQASGWLGDPQPTPQQRVWHRMAWGCFHDLTSGIPGELAGMGLGIIGNLCKLVARKQLSTRADAILQLVRTQGTSPIRLPWPGMPDARPMPLDLVQLPYEFAMFLHQEDGQFKHRIDRLALMRQIEEVWVPELVRLMEAPSNG